MKLRNRFLLALPLLALGHPCGAQAPAPPPTEPTLAESLALARPPDSLGVVLAVDPAKTALPKEAAAPDAGAAVPAVAQVYGRLAQDFGPVTAVAPATMVVLNTQPVAASPFTGLPSGQALQLLLSTLTAPQWKMLTGETGLGPDDLGDDNQRALFGDVLPPAPWNVIPARLIGTVHHDGDDRDLTAERPTARLRLRLHIGLNLPAAGGKGTVFVSAPMGPRAQAEGGHLYHLSMRSGGAQPKIAGTLIRAKVPNVPKEGQLDLDGKAFAARVPLAGLRTVGDLVARVGGLTRLEIYADAHYEKKALSVTGPATSARAADLLRALAFCLTGTYRRVGPAFVLTDDVQGVGTRRQALAEFEADTDARRKAALDRAATALAGHSDLDLPPADPGLAFSAEERAQIEADKTYQAAGFVYHKFPFSALTAAQKQIVRASEGQDETGAPIQPDLTAEATVSAVPLLEWVVPSLDGPIAGSAVQFLFPGPRAQAPPAPPSAAPVPVAAKPLPSWTDLMRAVPFRALSVRPRTAAQAQADVAAARTLGLNQVWVDAFSAGVSHEAALDAALAAAKGTGVRVYAVLDLLDWGPKERPDLADLTILGETSAQAAAREQDREAQIASDKGDPPPARPAPRVMVSLSSPAVRQTLLSLVAGLAARPGLAGMVWRATDPAGYTLIPGSVYDNRPALGYTEGARLAFLRQSHVDPIDLATSQILLMDTDTSLPLYEGGRYSDQFYAPLAAQWRKVRSDANVALLREPVRGGFGRPVALVGAGAGPQRRPVRSRRVVRELGQSQSAAAELRGPLEQAAGGRAGLFLGHRHAGPATVKDHPDPPAARRPALPRRRERQGRPGRAASRRAAHEDARPGLGRLRPGVRPGGPAGTAGDGAGGPRTARETRRPRYKALAGRLCYACRDFHSWSRMANSRLSCHPSPVQKFSRWWPSWRMPIFRITRAEAPFSGAQSP